MRPAEQVVLVSIVVVIAAALRIGFVTTADVQVPLRVDAGQYAQYSHNLIEHGVYSLEVSDAPRPDSFRSPGYPWFLTLCRAIAGEQWYGLARALQIALSTMTVLFAFGLARQFLSFGPALAGAVLVTLSPHLVVSPAFILTECLSAFVVIAGLWLLVGAASVRRTIAGALLLGCAPICNETLVLLPVLAAFAIWRRGQGRRLALVVLATALVPFAAWTVRNQVTDLHRRGSERATASISHGSYPGMIYQDPRWFGFPYREDPAQPEFGSSWSNLFDVLGPRVAAEPLRYAKWYLIDKPLWLWGWPLVQGNDIYVYPVGNSPYERQPVVSASYVLMRWLHVPVMLLALGGAVLGMLGDRRERSWAPLLLGLVAVFGTLAYLPVIPDARYLQPFRPLLFVLAAGAIPWAVGRLRRRGERDDVELSSAAEAAAS